MRARIVCTGLYGRRDSSCLAPGKTPTLITQPTVEIRYNFPYFLCITLHALKIRVDWTVFRCTQQMKKFVPSLHSVRPWLQVCKAVLHIDPDCRFKDFWRSKSDGSYCCLAWNKSNFAIVHSLRVNGYDSHRQHALLESPANVRLVAMAICRSFHSWWMWPPAACWLHVVEFPSVL